MIVRDSERYCQQRATTDQLDQMDGTLAESTKRLTLRDVSYTASGRDDESSGWIERGRINDYNRAKEKGRELVTIDPQGNADRLRQSGWASWGITPSDT